MKQKNPLYLVKGKTVHPAQGVLDYIILKFNLRPLLNILNSMIRLALEQVKDYPSFVFAKNLVQEITEGLHVLKARFSF